MKTWSARTNHGTEISVSARAVLETSAVAALIATIASRHDSGLTAALALAVTVAAVATLSTLGHELGHLLLARHFRLTIVAVRVHGLLSAGVERTRSDSRRAEVLTCLAGPLVTLLLAGVGTALAGTGGPAAALGTCLAATNVLALIVCAVPPHRSDLGRAWAAGARQPHPTLRTPASTAGTQIP